MTAEQMFQDLGFNKVEETISCIDYVKKNITFGYQTVTFYLSYMIYDTSDGYEELDITPELHLAITQQMKELGWLL